MKRVLKIMSRLLGTATLALGIALPVVHAQDAYPNRTVTVVVPAAAGSGTDLLAREVLTRLSQQLKQSFVIDNKPGGSGVLGTGHVVRAAPDGYTLLWTNGSFTVMAPALVKNMPYDVAKDLVPVAQTAAGGVILSVNKDFPANNLQELVAHVKANPGKYTYGSWGVGSSGHLIMEWLKKQTGMEITHVPYRAPPQLLAELRSGVLQIGWSDPAAPVAFIESGFIKGIAISGNARAPRTAQIPTMAEQGHRFDAVGWFGLFAPAGTPPAIVKRLHDEINKIQGTPEMAGRMTFMNFAPPPMISTEEFNKIVLDDLQTWKTIVTDAGITTEN